MNVGAYPPEASLPRNSRALLTLAGAIAVVAIAATLSAPNGFIGQGNLTQGQPNFIDTNGFDSPVAVAIDLSVSPNHVYVADWNNNRVLGWESASGFINRSLAALEFGEHDPGANDGCMTGPSDVTLCHPGGVAVDSNGNLFVADSGNNRVLEYNAPFLTDTVANEVFGTCGDFTGEGAGCTRRHQRGDVEQPDRGCHRSEQQPVGRRCGQQSRRRVRQSHRRRKQYHREHRTWTIGQFHEQRVQPRRLPLPLPTVFALLDSMRD